MKNNNLSIKNISEASADLYVYGDIVDEKWWDSDVSAQDVKTAIENLHSGATLNMYVNSGGGSVFVASAMVSMLNRAKENGITVHAYVDGLAASAASFLIMAADQITMYSNSMIMVHKPLCMVYGNSTDLLDMAEKLDHIQESVMMPLYRSKMKCTEDHLRNLIDTETWLSAEETADIFDVEISSDQAQIAASVSNHNYMNVPEKLLAKKEPEPVVEPIDYSEFENVISLTREKIKNA